MGSDDTAADLVIETLADETVALREQIASLEADGATYRELALAAFDALRDLTVRHERRHRQYEDVCRELRALRETLVSAHSDEAA